MKATLKLSSVDLVKEEEEYNKLPWWAKRTNIKKATVKPEMEEKASTWESAYSTFKWTDEEDATTDPSWSTLSQPASSTSESTRATSMPTFTSLGKVRIGHCTALHCTALHYTALHCTAPQCTVLHCTALHIIALTCTALHCTALHCTALNCTELHRSVNYYPFGCNELAAVAGCQIKVNYKTPKNCPNHRESNHKK